jgi:protein-disulfide isomerase
MRDAFANAISGVLVIAAVVVLLVFAGQSLLMEPRAGETEAIEVSNWTEIDQTGRVLGPSDAVIRIIEFSDFQCPFCAQSHFALQEFRDRYPGRVATIYRHFPLPGHPYAFEAAHASECAGDQGMFEAYHHVLFERQSSIGQTAWDSFAEDVGIPDVEEFRRCMGEERFKHRVEQDREVGKSIGVSGTPAYIVNGRLFTGMRSAEAWKRTFSEELD